MRKIIIASIVVVLICVGFVILYRKPTVLLSEQSSGGAVFTNNRYGFSLTFPETWQTRTVHTDILEFGNYTFYSDLDSIIFGLPDKKDIFYIAIFTKEQWKKVTPETGPNPGYLGENNKYVFAWGNPEDAYMGGSFEQGSIRMAEVEEIIKSFVTTKQQLFFITDIVSKYNSVAVMDDQVYATIDQIDFLTSLDGECNNLSVFVPGIPDCDAGFLIQNNITNVLTLPISPTATIHTSNFGADPDVSTKLSLAEFETYCESNKYSLPFYIDIQNGVITNITEKYLP